MLKKTVVLSLALVALLSTSLHWAWEQQSSVPGLKSQVGNIIHANKAQDELLEPDVAFKLKVAVKGGNTIAAELIPANGYYLYRDRIQFTLQDADAVVIDSVKLPPGEVKTDATFGRTETYPQPATAEIVLKRTAPVKEVTLHATYQGCHQKLGVCYSPIEKTTKVALP